MFVIVCYDVPARKTNVYRKLLREFLVHEQASVFMGDLPESEVTRLDAKLSKTIDFRDRVMRLVCRNRHNIEVYKLSKEAMGGQMRCEKDGWHGKDWALV